jgi:hypothetical protein
MFPDRIVCAPVEENGLTRLHVSLGESRRLQVDSRYQGRGLWNLSSQLTL